MRSLRRIALLSLIALVRGGQCTHDHAHYLATIIGKDANDARVVIHKVRRELFLA